jgi:hypothetical protein
MFCYRLAKDLGLLVSQVMEMSVAEFTGWAAFYKYEAEENKKALQKQRSK